MEPNIKKWIRLAVAAWVALGVSVAVLGAQTREVGLAARVVGASPWGPGDELGRLNLMNTDAQARLMARVDGSKSYDLSVDYFIGMPSWQAAGDPHYRMWMTHTPRGTAVDDPLGVGREMNEHVSYTGAAISMYTHMGTHIDALSHFGLSGRIFNGFRADEYLGDRGWTVSGAATIPPILARGVLIDVAAAHGVDMLPAGYRIGRADLMQALDRQGVDVHEGDVVLIRTGRMRVYDNASAYMDNPPGIGIEAARYLVEEKGAMAVGADNLSLEAFPSELEDDYVPVHTYLLGQQGAPILELVNLEELSRDQVWEMLFIGGSLKLRGADAAPIRPIALPLKRDADPVEPVSRATSARAVVLAGPSNTSGWFFAASGGGYGVAYEGDREGSGAGGGLGIGFGFSERFSVYLSVEAASISEGDGFDGLANGDDYALVFVNLGGRFHFRRDTRWVPFAEVAGTAVGLAYDNVDGEEVRYGGPSVSVGGGLLYYVSPRVALEGAASFTVGSLQERQVAGATGDVAIGVAGARLRVGVSYHPFR